jgi:dihydroflavonol-4-reductase
VRVFVTGGSGFIGKAVVRRLRDRNHEIVATARSDQAVADIAAIGGTAVRLGLDSPAALEDAMRDCDGVIHGAAVYRIGIAPSERPAMWDANVGATERVINAAIQAGVGRIVHVSTANVFGNTRGRIVDETYRREAADRFLSYYDETKLRAHQIAEAAIASGAPIIIAMPGGTYGPGDHSAAGGLLRQAFEGRLRAVALGDAGLAWTHVDDVAGGIVATLERGRIGESYVLAGVPLRLAEAVTIAARLGGHKPPRFSVPATVLRAATGLSPLVRLLGGPGDLAEVVRAADGVTYWAAHDKAERELGFQPRSLEVGIRDTFGRAAGLVPGAAG